MPLNGIGWNFMFVAGSTLVTKAYWPAEPSRTQAASDFLVFGTAPLTSLSSGQLLHHRGWQVLLVTAGHAAAGDRGIRLAHLACGRPVGARRGGVSRRVKTQSSLPTEDAALVLLSSLLASRQMNLRKIDGRRKVDHIVHRAAEVGAGQERRSGSGD